MRLVTYQVDQKIRVGIINRDGGWIYPIEAAGLEYQSMLQLVRGMSSSEAEFLEHIATKEPYDIYGAAEQKDVRILAPIPVPDQDIICLGLNYLEHAQESASYKKEAFSGPQSQAVYFSKRVNQAVADGDLIKSHRALVKDLDYEVELAVVIGRDAYQVPPSEAKSYIFGYTILNDISARTVQTDHKQWYLGKSLDGFAPMGPCIVTMNTFPYPPKLTIQSKVNGEIRQDANTEQMIFNIDHIISELSQAMTLKAGTIISTGTPAGVGMGFVPPRFLQSGDQVECSIEGIGKIRNMVE